MMAKPGAVGPAEQAKLGLSKEDARILRSIRSAREDRGRHPSEHDPRIAAMVEGRQGSNIACTGKKAWFGDPQAAEKAASDCTKRYGETFVYYLCAYCTRYHLSCRSQQRRR